MADTLPIDASNRSISGRREEVVMGCSMEALTRKGRNSRTRRTGNDTHEGLNGAQLRRAGKWERQVGVGFYE